MSIRKVLALTVTAALAVVFGAGPASAHPKPTAYGPGDGASIPSPPTEAWVDFDETVSQGTIEVYDPCGARVDQGEASTLATRVSVDVAADKAGRYVAVWTVIGNDSHKVTGDWAFTSTGGEPCDDGGSGGGGGEGSKRERTGSGGGGGSNESNDPGDPSEAGGSGGGDRGDGDTTTEKKGKKGGSRKHGKHGRHHGGKKDGTGNRTTAAEAARRDATEPTSGSLSDLPIDWLLVAFGVSAMIGAAAGLVYNSILGHRR